MPGAISFTSGMTDGPGSAPLRPAAAHVRPAEPAFVCRRRSNLGPKRRGGFQRSV